jgi:uncharacterized protein
MSHNLPRRAFLKTVPMAAGMLASPAPHAAPAKAVKAADVAISGTPYTPVPDYPIRPKRYSEVTLHDTFWKPKIDTNVRVTIPFEVRKMNPEAARLGFNGNVLEAAILSLATHPDPELQVQVDARIAALKQRTYRGNTGFEAAVTYYQVTGKLDLLEKAIQAADVLYQDFKVRKPPFSGGERDAINCVQLYRATHEKRYLDLAKHYIDIRGLEDSVNRGRHNQAHMPVLEQTEVVGHAVNCASLMVSLVDVGVLTGLREYLDTGLRLWHDAATRKMYVTGGVGATGNEGFGEAYALPNISAYSETCAVLMFLTLNHKLFLATGDSKYIDVMERGMYNNAIDGVSVSGDHFFYVNRLASAGDGRDLRWERASLECCPPNLVRFLAQMPGYLYAQDRNDAIYVNLYVSSDAVFQVKGKALRLLVTSELPWGAVSKISVSSKEEVRGIIRLRVPGWARNRPAPGGLYSYLESSTATVRLQINGKAVPATVDPLGYISLDRTWKDGDSVEIAFPVEPRSVVADQRVKEDRGRMAVERGPIVYCAEWPDASGASVLESLFNSKAELRGSFAGDLFGGVTVIDTQARKITSPSVAPKPARLIPYYLWSNRGKGEMSVWLSTREYAIGDTGPAGGLIFYDNPNYAAEGWRYLEAMPFDQSDGAKWGCFRTAIPGARGTAVGTGKQNTADILAACPEPGFAAWLCANLTANGVRGWHLPSREELALMYRNLRAAGLGDFRDGGLAENFNYWTSTQASADMAGHLDFADFGRYHYDDKDFPRRVRAIRAF